MKTNLLNEADQNLIACVLAGQRRALAKAITLIESTRPDHRLRAEQIINAILPTPEKTIRIGISGAPGAGKSTFIEALGILLADQGRKIAVLAVDPSSSINGGSILGDKTRMEMLSHHENSFIRPSPSAGSLGGVAEKTREAMLLCEAAGYEIILVETVGVGQSETTVAGMVDFFCLIQLPNAGDDLQAIKKGIVEIADMVIVNKADIDPNAAAITTRQWKNALALLHPISKNWQPPVLSTSALEKKGLEAFWQAIEKYEETMRQSGEWLTKRQAQSIDWMWQLIKSGLQQSFREHPVVRANLADFSNRVRRGELSPTLAAQSLLHFLQQDTKIH